MSHCNTYCVIIPAYTLYTCSSHWILCLHDLASLLVKPQKKLRELARPFPLPVAREAQVHASGAWHGVKFSIATTDDPGVQISLNLGKVRVLFVSSVNS